MCELELVELSSKLTLRDVVVWFMSTFKNTRKEYSSSYCLILHTSSSSQSCKVRQTLNFPPCTFRASAALHNMVHLSDVKQDLFTIASKLCVVYYNYALFHLGLTG